MKKLLSLFIVIASINAQSLAMQGAGAASGAGVQRPPAGGAASTAGAGPQLSAKAKTGLVFLTASGFIWAANKTAESDRVVVLSKKLGVDSKDLSRVICTDIGLVAGGMMLNDDAWYQAALYAPLAAIVGRLTTIKEFNEIVREIPIIGKHLVCTHKDCDGVCKDCVLTYAIKVIFSYQIAREAIPFALTYVGMPGEWWKNK